MATLKPTIILLLSIFTVSLLIKSSDAGKIGIYWGQNSRSEEGTLEETCDSGNYDMVLIAFLREYGYHRTPKLHFGGHCGEGRENCTILESDIKHCQSIGVKVFLSIGGPFEYGYTSYTLTSEADAIQLAEYLYTNFLSGQHGPLGSVTLDGIDFNIRYGSTLYYDVLVGVLNSFIFLTDIKLAASPQCVIPDEHLNAAIFTGLFKYIFIQFYDNPSCQYNGNFSNIVDSWKQWLDYLPYGAEIFLGLQAAEEATRYGGYIPPDVFNNAIGDIKQDDIVYGGVVLWNRYWDLQTNYSHLIKDSVSISKLQAH